MVKYYYLIIGGILLFKKLLVLLIISFLLSSCATTSSEPKYEAEEEELSTLEQISKQCLDDPYEPCNEMFLEQRDKIEDEQANEIIEKYREVFYIINSEDSLDYKERTINSNMNSLHSKGYDIIIEKHKEKGNKYFVQLLEEGIQPLAQLYNSQEIGIGMDKIKVVISMGFPNDINRTVTENSKSEQWVYDNGVYVYLENGEVTSFQD
jgi:hypothetical protein